MEHNHFRHLPPSTDYKKVSDAVRACFEVLRKHKYSDTRIANLISEFTEGRSEINENTLKSWLNRGDSTRANKSNTLELLYNFIIEYSYKFDYGIRAEMAGFLDTLNPGHDSTSERRRAFQDTMEHVFGGLLLNWVGISPESLRRYQQELSSDYWMFRRSVRSHEHIVRSEVSIKQLAMKDLSVTHVHFDRNEEERRSSGFMVPAEFNHFAVMNVENGSSIEFLALKRSITERYKRLIGFIVTINSNGVLVCARTVLLKKSQIDFRPPIRFHERKFHGDKVLKKTLSYLDDDRAMTIPDMTKILYGENDDENFAGE